MSTNAAPAITDQDVSAAQQVLYDNAWSGAFFNKLAEYGHVGQSREEQEALLGIADYLRQHETQQKQASATSGPYSQMRDLLAAHLGHAPQQKRASARAKAANVLSDGANYNAALTLKLVELQTA